MSYSIQGSLIKTLLPIVSTNILLKALINVMLIASLILLSTLARAELIYSENFETEGLNQRYYSVQAGSFDGPRTARDWHWQRQSANSNSNTSFYTNAEGQDYWAGINLDENGSSQAQPSTLTFNAVSLTAYKAAILNIDLASSNGLEKTDFLSIFAIDFVTQQKTLIDSFESGTSLINGYNLNSAFQTFQYSLGDLGLSAFKLSIEAFSNASKESFAIDNIRIVAEPLQNDNENAQAVSAPSHLALLAMFGIGLCLRKQRC